MHRIMATGASRPLFAELPELLVQRIDGAAFAKPESNRFGNLSMLEFTDTVLGAPLWGRQRDIVQSVQDNKFTAVASCHAIGKTFTSARVAASFLQTNEDSVVITTAPTARQVRTLLWQEIRSAASHAYEPLHGRRGHPLQTQWYITDSWYALGFKSGDQNTDAAQGYHAKSGKLLVIVDEAAGVSEATFDSVRRILTGTGARLLIIGNPTSMGGTFREAFHERSHLWHTISVPADQTPNFTTYGITRADMEAGTWKEKVTGPMPYPSLIDPEYVAQEIEYSGADHPDIQSRIWAEWPTEGADTLISLADIERAQFGPDDAVTTGPAYAGVDIARFGGDESVVWLRIGELTLAFKSWRYATIPENTGMITEFCEQVVQADGAKYGFTLQDIRFQVDATGLGAGVADELSALGLRVRPVNFAEKSSDPEKWPNVRHEMWHQLAARFRESRIRVFGEFDRMTRSQLSDVKKKYSERYRQPLIETKDEAMKRGRKSPDRAEAMMLAYANLKPKVETRMGPRSIGGAVAKGPFK